MAGETPITVVGNLTADPELRFTPSGAAVANFTVASTPRNFDRQTNEWKDGEALFLNCSVWRQAAENVAESLTKGIARHRRRANLKVRSYETREGEKRTVFEIDVDEIGPSLKYATAKVTKTTRQGGGGGYSGGGSGGGRPVVQPGWRRSVRSPGWRVRRRPVGAAVRAAGRRPAVRSRAAGTSRARQRPVGDPGWQLLGGAPLLIHPPAPDRARCQTTRPATIPGQPAEGRRAREGAPRWPSLFCASPRRRFASSARTRPTYVDYKDTALLRKFISDRGKIRARRVTGNCVQHQRDVAIAVKNAREVALLPYTSTAR